MDIDEVHISNDDQFGGVQPNPESKFDELFPEGSIDQPQMFVSAWEDDEQDIENKDMSDPVEQFLTAAEEGNLELMDRLSSENPALIQAYDRDKYTALHRAAYSDQPKVCAWLLSKGANPEAKTCEGNIVPLHLAINSSSDDPHKKYMTTKYLLEAPGIEMNAMNAAGDTPSTLARRVSASIWQLLQSHLN